MKIGTKSLLFGVHCFFIHPIVVAIAWMKLYGFPWDFRIWIAFFVHDLGYFGKPNMDGIEGITHVELGAKIMGLFGSEWKDFTMFHSRTYADKHDVPFSALCVADKYAICIEPYWFYMLRATLSGEIYEYMEYHKFDSKREWFNDIQTYMLSWTQNIESARKRFKK
jgi:hypothetical protein